MGTPQEITNAQGDLVWSVTYRAYGNVVRALVNEIDNPIRFQGQYHDPETGLHYNRHRYYNPNTGRFLTPDPIGLAGGLNNYQYVPNPTGWVDPLASLSKDEPGAAAEFSRLAQPGGLMATEGARLPKPNGRLTKPTHPLTKHGPDVSDAYLEARATDDLKNKGRPGMRTAFNDRAQMEEAIARVMEMNQGDISRWLDSKPRAGVPKAFTGNPGMGNLGRGYEVNSPEGPVSKISEPMESVNVVLIPGGNGEFLIHTAHPL